jgi:hypothetical protein
VDYAEYPLVVLGKADGKEVTRFTADKDGNYRATLPPGDYLLDLADREKGPGGVQAKPQPFTVLPNQTVRVDITVGTRVR